MKIKYFEDTDTALIEFSEQSIHETKEINENIYIDIAANGNLVGMTIEHARTQWCLSRCIAAGGDIMVQLTGVLAVGAFVFLASFVLWFAFEKTIGVRVTAAVEEVGQDSAELGIESYPEFVLMPDADDVDFLTRKD